VVKSAIIFGATGQDGSYLSEYLLELGYKVAGVIRRTSTDNLQNIRHIKDLELIEGDITDCAFVTGLIDEKKPDECYNLAAQSHVKTSFSQPILTTEVNYIGVLNILEAIRKFSPDTRFYQASTSEMFGSTPVSPRLENGQQSENTHFSPTSPYAITKVAAHLLLSVYRDGYDLYACGGILFNHESPRRGANFVTQKIVKWLIELDKWRNGNDMDTIYTGEDHIFDSVPNKPAFPKLRLGNLEACRDWGHAKDYVKAMHLMLQQDEAEDFIIATGTTHSIRDFLDKAFEQFGILDWEQYIVIDPKYFRPVETEYLCGNAFKAREKLGWVPEYSFDTLVEDMVESEISSQILGN
tara:strand:+ start:5229 stop:6287 length:1059 start_codon:yes stop_codon:yes gene_type:complete